MAIALQAEDKAPGRLGPGTYTGEVAGITRRDSSNGNPQAVLTWRVTSVPERGAEIKDFVTFTDKTHFRIRNILTAAGVPLPGQDRQFSDYNDMANWFAGALIGKSVEFVVRLEDDRNGARDELTGQVKQWPEIVGYQQPTGFTQVAEQPQAPASDVDNDASSFETAAVPLTEVAEDDKSLPF